MIKKVLVIHGPNMNLFGIHSAKQGKKLTLDKINRHIRRFIRNKKSYQGPLMLTKNKNTIHPLCTRCVKTCKQTVSVIMLTCEMFEPQMSDDEFEQLLNDMDEVTRQADVLHTRVNRLIDDMQEDVVVTEDDAIPDIEPEGDER